MAPPAYGRASLAELFPAILAAVGQAPGAPGVAIALPPARRTCLLLIDGLGAELLGEAARHDAPFLHELMLAGQTLDAGFPSSTPVSLCTLGTGRPPGEHGVVGFTMHVPPIEAVLECLAWNRYGGSESLAEALPPERLQPVEPLLSSGRRDGLEISVASLAEHLGSGLTRAAFRGARFDPLERFDDWPARRAAVRAGLERGDAAIVYTYDARLDTAMHLSGIGSPEWRAALAEVDGLARALASILPPGAVLLVTGDHGGCAIPAAERVDLADRPDLAAGVAWLSGDPRARHVHAAPGRAPDVLRAWRDGLDGDWQVLSREEAIAAGLFGPTVRDEVRPRIGDVVIAATGRGGIFDRRRYPWELRLLGFHGGLQPAEVRVPLLVTAA
jgi:hypothetical protein